ncbi:MAG: hypothetical protein ACFFCV_15945 [Promethearchaeota archaeon]
MNCQEIVCIEKIVDLQATYSVLNLSLSNLIEEILGDLKDRFIPILEIQVLLHSLKSVPFTDELKGKLILSKLTSCMKNLLNLTKSKWTSTIIMHYILKLQKLILRDYDINGSLVIYNDNDIRWDIDVSFLLNKGEIENYNLNNKNEVKT